jgi:hypothetical protein
MAIEPSNAEIVFWCVGLAIAIAFVLAVFLPWNPEFDPKGDDPYKDCPKEGEDW